MFHNSQENTSPMNGDLSPREREKVVKDVHKKEDRASPRSDASSHGSTSSNKHKEVSLCLLYEWGSQLFKNIYYHIFLSIRWVVVSAIIGLKYGGCCIGKCI